MHGKSELATDLHRPVLHIGNGCTANEGGSQCGHFSATDLSFISGDIIKFQYIFFVFVSLDRCPEKL